MWFIILGICLFFGIIMYAICATQPRDIFDDIDQLKYLQKWHEEQEQEKEID